MATTDPRDRRPRGPGRRQPEPRRADEQALHIAREGLLAAALELHESGVLDPSLRFGQAAEFYRQVEAQHLAALRGES